MQRWGVKVEVFAESTETPASYEPEARVHTGDLAAAIETFRPDVIHCHWLDFVSHFRDAARAAGVPITVRGHGFEFSKPLLEILEEDPVVHAVYLFPHLARLGRSPKVRSVRSAFDGSLYYPGPKDRRLVLRTAAATPTKDLTTFIDVARLCPDHRFVLVIGLAKDLEAFADEILEYTQSRGAPSMYGSTSRPNQLPG